MGKEARSPSALLFLCQSSGMTPRRATKGFKRLGIYATPMNAAIGLEFGDLSLQEDVSVGLQERHRLISEKIAARRGSGVGLSREAPLLVTSEDMARGLHFDA